VTADAGVLARDVLVREDLMRVLPARDVLARTATHRTPKPRRDG
jgi:hypothetical protein